MCELFYGSDEELKAIAKKASRLQSYESRIAKLKLEKEQLEQEIIDAIGHIYDGQTTYEVLDKKITVKTTFNYRVDKDAFENLRDQLPDNLVKVETKYTPIKKFIKEVEESDDTELNLLLSEFLTKTESKPSVKVVARA